MPLRCAYVTIVGVDRTTSAGACDRILRDKRWAEKSNRHDAMWHHITRMPQHLAHAAQYCGTHRGTRARVCVCAISNNARADIRGENLRTASGVGQQ